MLSALIIARYIITISYEMANPITNLRLQKLLYFVQLESLRRNGVPMFEDAIEAWQFGPVVPAVYYEYCNYAGMPILETYGDSFLCDDGINLINEVISEFEGYSVWELVNITHRVNSPWSDSYSEGNRNVIDVKLMRDFVNNGN